MLSSFREWVGGRLRAGGRLLGPVRDIYFDDQEWRVRYLVIRLGTGWHGDDLRVMEAGPGLRFDRERRVLEAGITAQAAGELPPASSVKPVCKQYESFGFGSPAARGAGTGGDPRLRSWRTVSGYSFWHNGEEAGVPADFLFDPADWTIKSLQVAREFGAKKVHFHLSPAAVERIRWAGQKIILRELKPVCLHWPALPEGFGHSAISAA